MYAVSLFPAWPPFCPKTAWVISSAGPPVDDEHRTLFRLAVGSQSSSAPLCAAMAIEDDDVLEAFAPDSRGFPGDLAVGLRRQRYRSRVRFHGIGHAVIERGCDQGIYAPAMSLAIASGARLSLPLE